MLNGSTGMRFDLRHTEEKIIIKLLCLNIGQLLFTRVFYCDACK